MTRSILLIFVALLLFWVFSLSAIADSRVPVRILMSKIPDIVATYGNNEQIKGSDVRRQLQITLTYALPKSPDGEIECTSDLFNKAVHNAVDNLIVKQMVLKTASRDGIEPDIASARKMFAETVVKNPTLPATLKTEGLTEEQIVKEIADSKLIEMWLDKITIGIVPDEKLKKYYEDNKDEFNGISFEEARKKIRTTRYGNRIGKAIKESMDKLIKDANVKYNM